MLKYQTESIQYDHTCSCLRISFQQEKKMWPFDYAHEYITHILYNFVEYYDFY